MMGQRDIRRLLVIGATAVIRWASRRGAPAGSWLAGMLERKPILVVAIALANKMARGIWAMLSRDEDYRGPCADLRLIRRSTDIRPPSCGRHDPYGHMIDMIWVEKTRNLLRTPSSLLEIWTRSAYHHPGQRCQVSLTNRPDKSTHPITCSDDQKILVNRAASTKEGSPSGPFLPAE